MPLDPDVAGLIPAYLLAERPESLAPSSSQRTAPRPAAHPPPGCAPCSLPPRPHWGGGRASPRATPHFGTALAEAGVDLSVLRALMATTTSARLPPTSISAGPTSVPPTTPPEPASAPCSRQGPAELLDAHIAICRREGGGCRRTPSAGLGVPVPVARSAGLRRRVARRPPRGAEGDVRLHGVPACGGLDAIGL